MTGRDGGAVGDLLRAEVEGGRLAGAVWRVEDSRGPVTSGAVGFAALEPEVEPTSVDVPYDLASLTKPLATALVAVLLEQDGDLDLRAAIGEVLARMRGSPVAAATLLDLGAHRAGLPAWRPLYLAAADLAGYVAAIAALPPEAAAGTTLYSDVGFILLGAALERVTGRSLDLLFDERVAVPLGLSKTGFARRGSSRFARAAATERGNGHERRLAGARGADFPWREEVLRGQVHDANACALDGVAGHAGLFGTAAEVAAIGREILRPRRLDLREPSRRRLLDAVGGCGTRTFGFVLAGDSAAARGVLPARAPGHTGFTGTSVWLDPDVERVYVLLTNRVHPEVPDRDFQSLRREFHRLAATVRP